MLFRKSNAERLVFRSLFQRTSKAVYQGEVSKRVFPADFKDLGRSWKRSRAFARRASASCKLLDFNHLKQALLASCEFRTLKTSKSLEAKIFNGEACHHTTGENRFPE